MIITNSVVLKGRLTGDVELKQAGKTVVANVSLAVNKDKENVDFIPVTLWGDVAKNVEKYVTKGMRIIVIGELSTNTYEKDGAKITKVFVNAKTVAFIFYSKHLYISFCHTFIYLLYYILTNKSSIFLL